jgi:UDP-N-acetylglucosamine acyltransferase
MAIKIGENNTIHPTAIIYDNVTIGDNNYIGAYSVIGSPAEYKGMLDGNGGVIIGNDNRITEFAVINSGTSDTTKIGDNNFFMRNLHVGHDCTIGDNNTTSAGVCLGGFVTLNNGITLGMGSIVHQTVEVPSGVMLGMGCVVTKKTELRAWFVFVGNPARQLKFNQIGYDRENPTKKSV